MEKVLREALNYAEENIIRFIPQTKKKNESISILDVNPLDIVQFMKDNDIPNNAYFDGKDNGYDGWGDILLSWEVEIETTDDDKLKYKRRTFGDFVFKHLYNESKKIGYKRVGFSFSKLKEFDDTTIYDMYINKEFDRLLKYYSLHFVKI